MREVIAELWWLVELLLGFARIVGVLVGIGVAWFALDAASRWLREALKPVLGKRVDWVFLALACLIVVPLSIMAIMREPKNSLTWGLAGGAITALASLAYAWHVTAYDRSGRVVGEWDVGSAWDFLPSHVRWTLALLVSAPVGAALALAIIGLVVLHHSYGWWFIITIVVLMAIVAAAYLRDEET